MSSTKRRITINATSAIIQVAFTAFLYFFLYKYLLNHLGIQQLGVWSLILSFSSIANLANMGLTSGLVKFVADYIAEKQDYKIGRLILTAVISLTILFISISIVIFYGAQYFLHFVIDPKFLTIAFSILPLSLAGLCVNAVAGVFTSVLEGYQKNYLRNFIYIFSGIVMYVATILLTPVFHLKGVAIAQIIQAVFVFLTALILIIRISPFNRFYNWKWSNQSFKELFNYGYKFQVVSICQLLYEPTTKLLLSKFGGLALLGHYEMATRLVNQVRALLVNANQVAIPVIAETVKTKSKTYLQEFYASMNRIMALFTFPLFTILIILSPLISSLLIGYYEPNFIYAICILTIGYIVNVMSDPAFFSCLGEGHLNIPIISHISMAIINVALGLVLGVLWGGYGIILAWSIATIVGSIVTMYLYHKMIDVSYRQILTKNEWQIIISSTLLIFGSILLFAINIPSINNILKTFILLALSAIIYIKVLRKNAFIKEILEFLTKGKNKFG